MTLGTVSTTGSPLVGVCACCGAKIVPYFSDDAVVSQNQINQLISESFLTVKGAALFLPRGSSPAPTSSSHVSQRPNKHTGDLRQHLQTMFTLLRPEDTIRLAVRLESAYPQFTRYMVVVSTNGRQDTEESIVLGMDFTSSDCCCTLGLVLPLWSDTLIHLDGDGGFSVSTVNRIHVFKPVSVQAMWSALQSLHKACEVARCHNYYPGSLFLTWVSYYQSRLSSDQFCINEWNAMQDVQSHRADSPVLFTDVPTERERTERLIKTRLREIMMQKDLENVTSKEIRTELEMQMVCNLREFKEFLDNEMIVILGQMDSPTKIFDHLYLGSEWNASNLEELQNSGVRYILNVTREIDNFFPGVFEYHNIRVYDEEATNLLEYWNETYKFISRAKKAGAKCLVHCKMGVSRSASTVIAYAMKEYGWDLEQAYDHVKCRRAVTKPNPSFMKQLEEYQGILLASKQRHNKLWRSHSDGDLSDRPEPLCKPASNTLGRSDPHNNNNISSPSLHHFLGVAVLQALSAEPLGSQAKSTETLLHNGVCDSPEEQESSSPHLLPENLHPKNLLQAPTPSPQASTLVPMALPLATSLSPGLPHLSPDLPERSDSGREMSPLTAGSSGCCGTPERSSSESMSSSGVSTLSPSTPPLPVPRLGHNDDNNNPSEARSGGSLEGGGDDSIDFFSAREKFLGLALDGRGRTLSDRTQQLPRTPPSPSSEDSEGRGEEEEQGQKMSQILPHSDSLEKASPDATHHHDNAVSVRHIVTEIESISCPVASPTLPLPCRSPPHPCLSEQQEDQETGEVTGGGFLTPPPPPASAEAPCDWPPGSVRRATKQLEWRLKQGTEPAACPHHLLPVPTRSSPHSPSAEEPALCSPLYSPAAESPPSHFPQPAGMDLALPSGPEATQVEPAATYADAKAKDGEALSGPHIGLQCLHSPGVGLLPDSPDSANVGLGSGASPVTGHTRVDSHTLGQTPAPPGTAAIMDPLVNQATSPQTQTLTQLQSPPCPQPPSPEQPQSKTQPRSPSSLLSVAGVTIQESDSDAALVPSLGSGSSRGGCSPSCDAHKKLAHSSQDLERIQQTLRELQAFLHEGGAPERECPEVVLSQEQPGAGSTHGSRENMDAEPGPRVGEGSEEHGSGSEGYLWPGSGVTERLGFRDRQGKSFRAPAAWQRAVELEARIRQAGLTPPSQMKRSASLAKLDCLELSADDLSDWDLRPPARTSFSVPRRRYSPCQPHPGPDDSWKKQRVLVQIPPSQNVHRSCRGGSVKLSSSPPSASLLVSTAPLPPLPWREEETGEKEEMTGTEEVGHQRCPSRSPGQRRRGSAEKREQTTATVLYNTM